MRFLRIGGTELEVSALCCGSGPFNPALGQDGADRLYGMFRQAGGNFFDTAHCYGFWTPQGTGCFERTLGECIRRRGEEGKVVVATKGGHPDAGENYPRPDAYLAPEIVAADITDSLARLGVESIDLYFLHRDDTRTPAGEIIEMLNAEVARGRIRYLGASNWTTARLAEANAYAAAHGLRPFAVSQVQWSLAQPNAAPPAGDRSSRFLTDEDAAWHAASKLPVMAYSSTARGYFATAGASAAKAFENLTTLARLRRAQTLAAQLGATPNQIALAYLLCQDFPVIPILGTAKPDHLADALSAVNISLTPEQVHWLREA